MREFEKLADEIARKIDRAVNDVENKIKDKVKIQWESRKHRSKDDFRSRTDSFKRVPDRLSDLATDGGSAMRYLTAYGMKAFGLMMGLGGLITASVGAVQQDLEPVSVGLSLLVFSQAQTYSYQWNWAYSEMSGVKPKILSHGQHPSRTGLLLAVRLLIWETHWPK